MRNKGDPQGRVYEITPKSKWSRDTKDEVKDAGVDITDLPSRTVLVVSRRARRRGWCKVACIVHEKDPSVNEDLYVPISPTRKKSSKGIYLNLCSGAQFDKPSWLCLDQIVELPRWVLEDAEMELESKSFDKLEEYMEIEICISSDTMI